MEMMKGSNIFLIMIKNIIGTYDLHLKFDNIMFSSAIFQDKKEIPNRAVQ